MKIDMCIYFIQHMLQVHRNVVWRRMHFHMIYIDSKGFIQFLSRTGYLYKTNNRRPPYRHIYTRYARKREFLRDYNFRQNEINRWAMIAMRHLCPINLSTNDRQLILDHSY